jgi:hypothetical protein
VLKGRSPNDVVRSRLTVEPKLANRRYKPPDSDALPQALKVVAAAKEVSHQTPRTSNSRRSLDLTQGLFLSRSLRVSRAITIFWTSVAPS